MLFSEKAAAVFGFSQSRWEIPRMRSKNTNAPFGKVRLSFVVCSLVFVRVRFFPAAPASESCRSFVLARVVVVCGDAAEVYPDAGSYVSD